MENKQKIYCEECRDFVETTSKCTEVKETIKNITFTYQNENVYCQKCHFELFVPEVHDCNLKNRLAAFKKSSGLISKNDIAMILEKYKIGKRPLSMLLGWGELTVTRYLDKGTPTKEYSDILKKILSDPFYYLNKLEKAYLDNKITKTGYVRSKKAVDDIFKENKITMVANYVVSKEHSEITPLALQKVLYYISGFYFAFYSQPIFNLQPEAWVHGPVYKNVYNIYKGYRYQKIESNGELGELLTDAEREIIDSVINAFGVYSGKSLEYMTHLEEPWLKTRSGLPEDTHSDRIITDQLMTTYFENILRTFKIERPEQIKKYAKSQFDYVTN